MSQWKVSKEIIEIFPHPNADAIELAKVGDLQLVVGKGIYKTGDCVLVLPYKTVLSGNETIHASQDFKYLGGSAHDRVIEHTMRGEISQGANVPIHIVHNSLVNAGLSEMASAFWDAELGVDISELLNLTKYEPPIPVNLTGVVERMTAPFIEHDAVQFGISLPKLLGKYISVTEKLHGCQLNVSCDVKSGEIKVTTKGLGEREQQFKEHSPYVQGAIDRSGILEAFPRLINNFTAVGNILVNAKKELVSVQAIGELTGVQKGYHYGHMHPTLFIFRIVAHYSDGSRLEQPPQRVASPLDVKSAPVLFEGVLVADEAAKKDYIENNTYHSASVITVEKLYELATGNETVSGKETSIREGCVIVTMGERNWLPVFDVVCKLINTKYAKKSKGDEFS